MINRIRELRWVQASTLEPHPENWRRHPAVQASALTSVLKYLGVANALLTRELPDGRLQLIDGHLRADLLADQTVPVLVTDLTEDEARRVLVAFDQVGSMAERDPEALKALFDSLGTARDVLAAAVWPDYIRDPAAAASYQAPPVEAVDPDSLKPAPPYAFTADQYDVVERACMALRADEGDASVSEGRCLELICANYLAGLP